MYANLIRACVALLGSVAALAAANVTSVRGEVSAVAGNGSTRQLANGDRLESGSRILTGANGLVVLKFDDGQIIALERDTDFTISQYRYNKAEPASGNAFFSMLRGSLRAITGLIGQSNKAAFRLNTPTATIGIRGSDWMAALLQNNLYTGVNSGGINVGSMAVNAGQYSATLGSNATQLVSFSQLPANVFGSLPNLSLGGIASGSSASSEAAGSSGMGGGAGLGGGTTGAGMGAIAAGAGLATAIAITANTNDSSPTHTPPNHSPK